MKIFGLCFLINFSVFLSAEVENKLLLAAAQQQKSGSAVRKTLDKRRQLVMELFTEIGFFPSCKFISPFPFVSFCTLFNL